MENTQTTNTDTEAQDFWDAQADELDFRHRDNLDRLRGARSDLREEREEGNLSWELWRTLDFDLQDQEQRTNDFFFEESRNLRHAEREFWQREEEREGGE